MALASGRAFPSAAGVLLAGRVVAAYGSRLLLPYYPEARSIPRQSRNNIYISRVPVVGVAVSRSLPALASWGHSTWAAATDSGHSSNPLPADPSSRSFLRVLKHLFACRPLGIAK